MDKVINCLFAAITLLLSARGEVFKGKQEGGPEGVWTERWRRAAAALWHSLTLVLSGLIQGKGEAGVLLKLQVDLCRSFGERRVAVRLPAAGASPRSPLAVLRGHKLKRFNVDV